MVEASKSQIWTCPFVVLSFSHVSWLVNSIIYDFLFLLYYVLLDVLLIIKYYYIYTRLNHINGFCIIFFFTQVDIYFGHKETPNVNVVFN